MAQTTKKKDPAPDPEATTALQEAEAPQEGHLDPEQFKDMDDDNLRGLAQDLGLDPAAYEGRDALIAAIAAVPVIPGPPEPEPEPEAPAQEINPEPEAAPAQEINPEPEAAPAQEDPAPAPEQEDPEPDPAGERHTPYKATVAVSLATLHKEVGLGTTDMLKAVGTLRMGAAVTVTGRKGTYAQLKNGLYILETLLEVQTT